MLCSEATKKNVDFALVYNRKNHRKSSSRVDAVSIRENATKNKGFMLCQFWSHFLMIFHAFSR